MERRLCVRGRVSSLPIGPAPCVRWPRTAKMAVESGGQNGTAFNAEDAENAEGGECDFCPPTAGKIAECGMNGETAQPSTQRTLRTQRGAGGRKCRMQNAKRTADPASSWRAGTMPWQARRRGKLRNRDGLDAGGDGCGRKCLSPEIGKPKSECVPRNNRALANAIKFYVTGIAGGGNVFGRLAAGLRVLIEERPRKSLSPEPPPPSAHPCAKSR